MADVALVEWYYVGHYGQLGPLTLDQMKELVRDGVIDRQTFVWHTGRPQWSSAETYFELRVEFEKQMPSIPPPVPFMPPTATPPMQAPNPMVAPMMGQSVAPAPISPYYGTGLSTMPESDRSRVIAGVLQLIVPGVGRMYLGYYAIGFVQLLSVPVCAVGWFWSIIDGIAMLLGNPKFDGFGRRLVN